MYDRVSSGETVRRDRQLIISVGLLLLALSGHLASDETEYAGSVVLVAVGSQSEGTETVRRVAYSSVEIYLEQQGIVAVGSELRPVNDELSAELAEQALAAGADFVLVGTLVLTGNEIDVDLSLYLVDAGQLLTRESGTMPVGLTLDRAISALAASLLDQAAPYLRAASAVRAEDADPTSNSASERAAVESSPVDLPPVESPLRPMPVERLLAIEVGFVPFLPVDPTAAYIAASVEGASLTALAFPFAGDYLGIGILARGARLVANGAATSAELVLVPVALATRVSGRTSPMAPYLQVGIGGGFVRAENSILGSFTSIVPYGAIELGMRVEIFGRLGAKAYVGFDALLESSLFILGFAPGLGLSVEM
ncbi:MAG: hypothetical protein ACOC7V_16370 [Spirochaetota bacterium]